MKYSHIVKLCLRMFFFENSRSNSARTQARVAPIPTDRAISTSYSCLRRRLNWSTRNRFFITRNTSRVREKLDSLISIVSGGVEESISSSIILMLAMRLCSLGRISLFIVVECIAKYTDEWIFFPKEEFLCEERESLSDEMLFRF